MAEENSVRRLAREWWATSQQFVRDDGQTVPVCRWARDLVHRLLWRHVGWRPKEHAGRGPTRARGEARKAHHAEHHLALLGQQDVRRLHLAMYDSLAVDIV